MACLLVDVEVATHQVLIDARKPGVDYIIFDSQLDTYQSLLEKFAGKTYSDVAIVQHASRDPFFQMLRREDPGRLDDVAPYHSFSGFRQFVADMAKSVGVKRLDLLGCALYHDVRIHPIIAAIEAETGVDLRASTNFTGNVSSGAEGADWIMESDNVDIRETYFTEAITDFKELLYTYSNFSMYGANKIIKDICGNMIYLHKDICGNPINPRYDLSGADITFPEGSVVAWGLARDISGIPNDLSGVIAIYSTLSGFAALKADGSVITWGFYGGDSSAVANDLSSGVVAIYSTRRAFAAVKSDGSVVVWGAADYGGELNNGVTAEDLSGVVSIYSSDKAFAALKSDGSVVAWGYVFDGGDASAVINDLSSGVVAIYSTDSAFAALKSDGSVITWGSVYYGGDSSTVVNDLSSGVVAIYSTGGAFAALKSDRYVIVWGDPGQGGDISDVVNELSSGVVAIYSTQYAFAALKSDGSVVVWGHSAYGGDISGVANELSSGVVTIYSTNAAFAALKSDGSVISWGYPYQGGDSYGVANDLSSGVVSIYSTAAAFAALKSDGSVVAWGDTQFGGDISGVANDLSYGVVAIYSTQAAFAALKSDGTVVIWGNSYSGGLFNTSDTSGGVSGVLSIYSTGSAFAALKPAAPISLSDYYLPTGGFKSTAAAVPDIYVTNSSGQVKIDPVFGTIGGFYYTHKLDTNSGSNGYDSIYIKKNNIDYYFVDDPRNTINYVSYFNAYNTSLPMSTNRITQSGIFNSPTNIVIYFNSNTNKIYVSGPDVYIATSNVMGITQVKMDTNSGTIDNFTYTHKLSSSNGYDSMYIIKNDINYRFVEDPSIVINGPMIFNSFNTPLGMSTDQNTTYISGTIDSLTNITFYFNTNSNQIYVGGTAIDRNVYIAYQTDVVVQVKMDISAGTIDNFSYTHALNTNANVYDPAYIIKDNTAYKFNQNPVDMNNEFNTYNTPLDMSSNGQYTTLAINSLTNIVFYFNNNTNQLYVAGTLVTPPQTDQIQLAVIVYNNPVVFNATNGTINNFNYTHQLINNNPSSPTLNMPSLYIIKNGIRYYFVINPANEANKFNAFNQALDISSNVQYASTGDIVSQTDIAFYFNNNTNQLYVSGTTSYPPVPDVYIVCEIDVYVPIKMDVSAGTINNFNYTHTLDSNSGAAGGVGGYEAFYILINNVVYYFVNDPKLTITIGEAAIFNLYNTPLDMSSNSRYIASGPLSSPTNIVFYFNTNTNQIYVSGTAEPLAQITVTTSVTAQESTTQLGTITLTTDTSGQPYNILCNSQLIAQNVTATTFVHTSATQGLNAYEIVPYASNVTFQGTTTVSLTTTLKPSLQLVSIMMGNAYTFQITAYDCSYNVLRDDVTITDGLQSSPTYSYTETVPGIHSYSIQAVTSSGKEFVSDVIYQSPTIISSLREIMHRTNQSIDLSDEMIFNDGDPTSVTTTTTTDNPCCDGCSCCACGTTTTTVTSASQSATDNRGKIDGLISREFSKITSKNIYIAGSYAGDLTHIFPTLTPNASGTVFSAFLIKCDLSGTILNAYKLNTSGNVKVYQIDVIDNESSQYAGIYITGTYKGEDISGSLLRLPPSTEIAGFVAKYDIDTQFQWSNAIIPSEITQADTTTYFKNMTVTSAFSLTNNGIYVAHNGVASNKKTFHKCTTSSSPIYTHTQYTDSIIYSLNAAGNLIKVNYSANPSDLTIGSLYPKQETATPHLNNIRDIQVIHTNGPDDGIYVIGDYFVTDNSSINATYYSITMKYNFDGVTQWVNKGPSYSTTYLDYSINNPMSLSINNEGLYMTGVYRENSNSDLSDILPTVSSVAIYILKIDLTTGQNIWVKKLDTMDASGTISANIIDIGYSIYATNNHVYLTGRYGDLSGYLFERTKIGSSPVSSNLKVLDATIGGTAAFLLKYKTNGELVWGVNAFDSTANDFGIQVYALNNAFSVVYADLLNQKYGAICYKDTADLEIDNNFVTIVLTKKSIFNLNANVATIVATPIYGTAPYTYVWYTNDANNGATSSSIICYYDATKLTETITCEITDAALNKITQTFYIVHQRPPPLTVLGFGGETITMPSIPLTNAYNPNTGAYTTSTSITTGDITKTYNVASIDNTYAFVPTTSGNATMAAYTPPATVKSYAYNVSENFENNSTTGTVTLSIKKYDRFGNEIISDINDAVTYGTTTFDVTDGYSFSMDWSGITVASFNYTKQEVSYPANKTDPWPVLTICGSPINNKQKFTYYGPNSDININMITATQVIPCFAPGTMIATPAGERPVETIGSGDYVLTADGRAVQATVYTTQITSTTTENAPYTIPARTFGAAQKRAITLSPRHAVQIRKGVWEIPKYAAKRYSQIRQAAPGQSITYYHLELPNYFTDNLVANGIVAEAFAGKQIKTNEPIYVFSNKLGGFVRRAPVKTKIDAASRA